MFNQEENLQEDEHFGAKIGIILIAIILVIATYIVVQRSVKPSRPMEMYHSTLVQER